MPLNTSAITSQVGGIVSKNHFSAGGLTLEYLENYIA
jgi:hypothetical protein